MKSKFLNELTERNLIKDITPFTKAHIDESGMIVGYIGFDPTAPSLHVGNLCAIMLLKTFQECGHKPLILLGGYTGSIGDPSGKKEERKILENQVVEQNLLKLRSQFEKYLDFDCGPNSAEIVNNRDWLSLLTMEAFFSTVGKFMSVNHMLSKDSVKQRLETGISYTEFSYQLFQAYDFYWLHRNRNCRLQMGGSDQWGNVTAGIELIRKKAGKEVFGLTTHLLTKSDGSKFGKSESGNIWLDPALTSPYDFYQFWLNVDDAQVETFIKTFVTGDCGTASNVLKHHQGDPNALKKYLAEKMTVWVHSTETFLHVKKASELLFGTKINLHEFESTDEAMISEIIKGLPQLLLASSDAESARVIDAAAALYKLSNGEVRKLCAAGGLRINNVKITDPNTMLCDLYMMKGAYQIMQKGKTFGIIKTSGSDA